MVKIYTRSGDGGNTHLFGGEQVSKNSQRVIAYGAVDELNSHLGVIRSNAENTELKEMLKQIQALLFVCGADLASPKKNEPEPEGEEGAREKRIREEDVEQIETWIDEYTEELEPLSNFVLPGETPTAARFHMARSICRRAEREAVALQETKRVNLGAVIPFINRLSDLFFTLARVANERAGAQEIPWNAPLPNNEAESDAS